jgi:hypothetical protein
MRESFQDRTNCDKLLCKQRCKRSIPSTLHERFRWLLNSKCLLQANADPANAGRPLCLRAPEPAAALRRVVLSIRPARWPPALHEDCE